MISPNCKMKILAIFFIFFSTHVGAEEGHEHGNTHDENESHSENESHEKSEDSHDDGEHEDEGHDEEGGAKVGLDKGITEKSENGFKLSKEAITAFNVKFENFSESIKEIPKSAVVHIKNGKFIYRFRDGWIQRVSTSGELKDGDQFITSGTGFIRGAELILSEGATHSH